MYFDDFFRETTTCIQQCRKYLLVKETLPRDIITKELHDWYLQHYVWRPLTFLMLQKDLVIEKITHSVCKSTCIQQGIKNQVLGA